MRFVRSVALLAALVAAFSAAPSAAAETGQIAFTDIPKAGHPWRLALLDLGTGRTKFLTPPGQYAEMPAWSPDGRRLAFARSTAGGAQKLVVMNVATGKQRLIAAGAYLNEWPAWSPDGNRIAFVRSPLAGGGQQIWSIKPDGKGLRLLTRGVGLGRPAWSPNGKQILYGRQRRADRDEWDLWLMQRDGSHDHRLARNGTGPAWEPDGRRIAFGVPKPGTAGCCPRRDLEVMNRDGSGRRLLATQGGSPSWSPDGGTIAFQRFQGGSWNLWTVNPNGRDAHQLTMSPGDETSPAWRPLASPQQAREPL